jgi:type IV pilus assembly protein PilA
MQNNDGFTLVELLIVVAILAVLAAVATPSLLRARASGNEASAIASVRAINSAQSGFAATCGSGGFASTLTALDTPPPGSVSFIPADLATGIKSGYSVANIGGGGVVTAAASTCNAAADSTETYLVTATPLKIGITGQRSFGSDQDGTIFQDRTGILMTAPLTVGGNISVLQ